MPQSHYHKTIWKLFMVVSLPLLCGSKASAQSFEPLPGFKAVDQSWMYDNGPTGRPVQTALQSLADATKGIWFVHVIVRANDMLLKQDLPEGSVTETIAFKDIDTRHLAITPDTDYFILSIPLKTPAPESGVDKAIAGTPPQHTNALSPALLPVATDLATAARAIQDIYDIGCSAQGNCGAEISSQ
jgi:hypothetical protein